MRGGTLSAPAGEANVVPNRRNRRAQEDVGRGGGRRRGRGRLSVRTPQGGEQLWRTVMRRKYQITRNRVQLHNRLESLLKEAHIKLSSVVSDLLGTSARRMLQALADGETDPATLAALADQRLRATPDQLRDAF